MMTKEAEELGNLLRESSVKDGKVMVWTKVRLDLLQLVDISDVIIKEATDEAREANTNEVKSRSIPCKDDFANFEKQLTEKGLVLMSSEYSEETTTPCRLAKYQALQELRQIFEQD